MNHETANVGGTESAISQADALIASRDAVLTRARSNNDGENLSEIALLDREKVISDISAAIEEWVVKHMREGKKFTQDRLGELVHDIGDKHRTLLDKLVKESSDRTAYVGRPGIKIYEGVTGVLPDVWLLGWREDATSLEATDIHDHENSLAAFHVYQGCVDETIYAFDQEKLQNGSHEISFSKTSRGLRHGSTATIPAPYIHVVSDARDQQQAVTVHAYYPPLDSMNFYEEQEGGILLRKGNWQELPTKNNHCAMSCGHGSDSVIKDNKDA